MEEKEEWLCSCGTKNTGNFCMNCGQAKPAAGPQENLQARDSVSSDTVDMSVVRELPVQSAIQPPIPPAPGYAMMPPLPRKSHMTQILAVAAVLLLLAAIGVFTYVQGTEDRYVGKCVNGEKVVSDVQSLLKETKDLNGDPDADATKDYLVRLGKAKENLDKLLHELRSSRTGSKYQLVNQKLIDAVALERGMLDDVEKVIKAPLDSSSSDAVKRVQVNVKDLADRAGDISIPQTDFAASLPLNGLDDDLNAYIRKKQGLEAQKRAEAQQQAQAAEASRLQGIKDREAQRMQDILKGTTSIEYLVTNVRRTSSTRLDFDGFFYNGTGQPLQKVDSMVLSVTLYNHGEQVYQNSYDFYNTIYLGRVMPHKRQSRSLWVTDNSSIPVFDEYEVSAGSVHWTYWGS